MDCTYITLNCADCENSDCDLANKYIPDGSKEGCTRRVPEDIAALYYHYIEEVLPANGFTTTRSGAMAFVTKDDEDIKIEMLIDMYTKNFMRLNFSIINNQKNNFTRTY